MYKTGQSPENDRKYVKKWAKSQTDRSRFKMYDTKSNLEMDLDKKGNEKLRKMGRKYSRNEYIYKNKGQYQEKINII